MLRDAPTEDEQLTKYVLDHYRHLCTDTERNILTALNLQLKATKTSNPVIETKLREARVLTDDPIVREAVASGPRIARTAVRNRLLQDHGNEIVLNTCRNCGRLCRTPVAKMCVACGHSWHDEGKMGRSS